MPLLMAPTVAADMASVPRQMPRDLPVLAGFVAQMAGASAAARYDFAVLVVEALLAAYTFELAQAQRERPRDRAAEQKLRRWSSATASIHSELRALLAAVYIAEEVAVHADRHGQVLLLIDGHPLWVAWPRLSAQNRLEREVIEQWCQRHACAGVAGVAVDHAGGNGAAATERSRQAGSGASARQGNWVLAQRQAPVWQTTDGLRCEFADLSARAAKEDRCRAIVHDLHRLAAALRDLVQRGEPVAWPLLTVRADPSGGPPRLTLSAAGDDLVTNLTALTDRALDWPAARTWLQAWSTGRAATATVLRVGPGG